MKTQTGKALKVALAAAATLARRKVALVLCVALCTVRLAFPQSDEKATIITFDAPGACSSGSVCANSGTFGRNINPPGAIVGTYYDVNTLNHGFLRAPDGTITTIEPPGAILSDAEAINPAGVIAGDYLDASFSYHGFVRAPDGTFTTFDIPGLNFPTSINPAGAITGLYRDMKGYHGFLRAPDGAITTFNAPGAGTDPGGQGTLAWSINPSGAITGFYLDGNFVEHGFLRAPDGTITTFDAPGAATTFPFHGTGAGSINPAGAIAGGYSDANGVHHGYLRAPDGTFTVIDVPGSTGTGASAINPAGSITGGYSDTNGVSHGFLRVSRRRHRGDPGSEEGTHDVIFITFDAPGAGTASGLGTSPFDINPEGVITGWYTDASNVSHGFLRISCGRGDSEGGGCGCREDRPDNEGCDHHD
jgi:uncharacterized membrane protein